MTRPTLLSICLLAILLTLGVPGTARASEIASDWGTTKQGRVRLLAAPEGPGGALRLGLHFELQPDWKIYWRAPGDAGLPPEADWSGSTNLTVGETSWPTPDRFSYAGLETFGYEGEVVLPIAVKIPDPTAPVAAAAHVSFLTCAAICVPNEVDLSLDIPAYSPPSPESAALIDRFAALVPGNVDRAGLFVRGVSVMPLGKDAILSVQLRGTPPLQKPDLLVEGPDGFSFRPPTAIDQDGMTILSSVSAGGAGAAAKLGGHPLRLTVIDRASPHAAPRATSFSVMPDVLAAPAASAAPGLLPILALALLGGFILNFMPCVLPVLSMKLVALVGHSGRGRRTTRLGFLASSAGIIVSFLVMAGILIGMRSAGLAVGWGIQFQEPVFLAALAAIVTLFACNLFGWFEITLPWWLAGMAPGGGPSLGGNFLAGAFATLLATPCSAPFLGTAVGFALAGSPGDILLVFLCLGIGLALPYLAVAAVPGIARLMPRPGRWMLVLRRVLGVLLAGTAAWLIGVLVFEAGAAAAGAVAALALGAVVCLSLQSRSGAVGFRTALGAAAAVLLFGMLAPPLVIRPAAMAQAESGAGWVPFNQAAIAGAVASGKTVFVDVTASWCLTCQVNERLVLETDPVHQRLAAPSVVAMRADWTRRDARIGEYLETYGRYGIPFNVVYGPAEPGGVPLPELLTDSAVLDALRQASGKSS
jgi:suppressor for copper-sensitivity B